MYVSYTILIIFTAGDCHSVKAAAMQWKRFIMQSIGCIHVPYVVIKQALNRYFVLSFLQHSIAWELGLGCCQYFWSHSSSFFFFSAIDGFGIGMQENRKFLMINYHLKSWRSVINCCNGNSSTCDDANLQNWTVDRARTSNLTHDTKRQRSVTFKLTTMWNDCLKGCSEQKRKKKNACPTVQ